VLDSVRLVPVIEVYTGVLDREPRGPLDDRAFCHDRIVAAGLPPPVPAHPWLVRASDTRAGPGLMVFVRAVLGRSDDEDGPVLLERLRDPATRAEALDEVPSLPGGYLLECGTRCLALPGCCGDLGDIDEWQAAARHQGAARATLWIGHPWLMVSADGDLLTLTGPVDDDTGPGPRIGQIRRDLLAHAVAAAEEERTRFADQLQPVCAEIAGEAAAPDLVAGFVRLATTPTGAA